MATSSAPEFPYPGGTPGDEPADPVAGKPGHFAWSRWIKQFVKNLDASLMAHQDAADPHPQYVTTAELPVATVRVTHPNTDDVLVEAWDAGKSRWQRTHYDSGTRRILIWDTGSNVFSSGTPPDTTTFEYLGPGYFDIRRVGDVVTVTSGGNIAMAAGSNPASMGALLQLPSGFQGTYYPGLPAVIGSHDPTRVFGLTAYVAISRAGNVSLPPAGTYFGGSPMFKFDTADPLPTSLPGILVTPAIALQSFMPALPILDEEG